MIRYTLFVEYLSNERFISDVLIHLFDTMVNLSLQFRQHECVNVSVCMKVSARASVRLI